MSSGAGSSRHQHQNARSSAQRVGMSSSAPADSTAEALTGIIVHHPDRLLEEIERAGLLHLDETPWWKSGQLLWLWVFNAVTTVVYFIGARSAEIFITSFRAVRDGPSDDLTARQAPVLAQLKACANATHTVSSSNPASSAARCLSLGKRSSGRYSTPACR